MLRFSDIACGDPHKSATSQALPHKVMIYARTSPQEPTCKSTHTHRERIQNHAILYSVPCNVLRWTDNNE